MKPVACGMVAILLVTAIVGTSEAGERTNIRGLGMARTFVASSRGLDAAGINPANLGIADSGTVSISIVPIGVRLGSDFLTYGLFRTYFNGVETDSGRVGRHLSDRDKQEILAAFPGGMGTLSAEAEARLFGFSLRIGSFGAFALTVTERAWGSARVPDDYVRFLLYGNTAGSTYDFGSTRAGASWTREYALSFGMPVPVPHFLRTLTAGVAVKLVHGFGYFEVERCNARLMTAADGTVSGDLHVATRSAGIDLMHDTSGGYTPFPAPAGSGFGVDLGLAGRINDFLSFGLSVTDIGSVTWAKNVQRTGSDTSLTISDPSQNIDGEAVDRAIRGTKVKGGSFSTTLPTTLRAGLAVELNKIPFFRRVLLGEMMIACDYNQQVADYASLSDAPRFSLGMEYRPLEWLPLRTGVSFGGVDHSNVALGIGFRLGFLDLDFASDNLGWLFSPDAFSSASAAVGMRVNL